MQLDDIKDPIFVAGRKILTTLSEHGEAYIVGGAVRDLVMANQIHDVDISTNVPMEVIEALFETHDIGKNKDFGIVVVNVDGVNFEIAQFRGEGAYSDGRHPDEVKFGVSFKEDTKRRDFSFNSMGLDIHGNIIDYHGGQEDIKFGRLKTVGNAFDRFEEDLLRILRAIRFAARFGYQLDNEIIEAIEKQKSRILTVSMERIRDEILKTIGYGADKFGKAVSIMDDIHILDIVFPKIYSALRIPGGIEHYVHFFIRQMDGVKVNDPVVVLGALFQTLSEKDCVDLCLHLKLTTDDTKDILFINRNGGKNGNYKNLCYIDKQVALKIIQNRAFEKLRISYSILAKYNDDRFVQSNRVSDVLEYLPVQNKQKDVNAILLNLGFKGQDFGNTVKIVNDWMFTEFGFTKRTKSNEEIDKYILDTIKQPTK